MYNLKNNNKLKKQSCIIFLLIAVMHLQINIVKGQFIYRQADRAQIIYDNLIDSSSLSSGSRDKTINFDKPFLNIPKITLSIIWVHQISSGSQGFNLEILDTQKQNVLIRLTTNGMTITQFRICVLATDFPNSQLFKETNISGQSSKLYTAPGNILGYCAYFYGFKGDALSNTEMRFDFKSVQQDSKNILVNYDTNGVFGKNMISIDYNVLIIYEENSFDSSLYSFIFMVGQNYSGSLNRSITFDTDLLDQDKVMLGFRYQYIKSGTNNWPQIQSELGSNDNPIKNKKLQFTLYTGSASIQDGEIAMFQLIKSNPCHTSCNTCSGLEVNECLSCKTGDFYDNISSKCLSSQPDQYYCQPKSINSITYQNCFPCHNSCNTCFGGLINQCSSCNSGQFYDNALFKCLSSQPNQYYCQPKSINSITYQDCFPCHSSCNTCSGPLLSNCTSCQSGKFYDNPFKQCLNSQPNQYYCQPKSINSITYQDCFPCHSSCNTCSGSLLSNCTSCQSGQFYDNPLKQCLSSQPNQYYCQPKSINSITYQDCFPCHISCSTCSGPLYDNCTSCQSGQFYDNPLKQCLSSQPNQYYCQPKSINSITYQDCFPCHNSCKKCSGPLENQCTSCTISLFYDTVLFKCLNSQPSNYYCEPIIIDSQTQNTCYPCHVSCNTCSGPLLNNCTSCMQDQFYDNVLFKCSSVQPEKYYCQHKTINSQTYQDCFPCHNSCKACSGPLQNQCISCLKDQFFDTVLSNCLSIQPPKYYCEIIIDSPPFYMCYPCHLSCNTCTGSQPNQCSSCNQGQYYDTVLSKCLSSQPEKYYCEPKSIDSITYQICYPCHESCLTCDGPLYNQCTSCPYNHFTYLD